MGKVAIFLCSSLYLKIRNISCISICSDRSLSIGLRKISIEHNGSPGLCIQELIYSEDKARKGKVLYEHIQLDLKIRNYRTNI